MAQPSREVACRFACQMGAVAHRGMPAFDNGTKEHNIKLVTDVKQCCAVLHRLQQPWLLFVAEGTQSMWRAVFQCGGHVAASAASAQGMPWVPENSNVLCQA